MRPITHRFTLDMHDTQSQISIPVYCGDSGRKLFITLSEGGKPYEIGEGCWAYINARTPANTTQSLSCNIDKNTIIFDFAENPDAVNMIAVVGLTHCDVTLFDEDDNIVTAPRFTFVVVDQISNPRDVELTSDNVSLLSSWTSTFASWDTAETGRVSAENNRIGKEIERDNAEKGPNGRVANELERQSNELTRQSQEATRQRLYEEAKESLDTVIAKANEASESASIASSAKDTATEEANRATSAADRASASATSADSSAKMADAMRLQATVSANLASASSQAAAKARNEAVAAASSVSSMVVNKDLDYLIHYNFRMQQLTSDIQSDENSNDYLRGRRGISVLAINETTLTPDDFQGGKYTDNRFVFMHPKSTGEFSIDAAMGECGYLVVTRGITHINVGHNIREIDLTLFTGSMPFPNLSLKDANTSKVVVQKGRKAELMAMTNWSDLNIEGVEEW